MITLKKGFTLVEVLVVVTITTILISVGISAYAKARDRQASQATSELILTKLLENQKIANIGKKDCAGKFLGQRVVLTNPSTITSQTLCEGGAVGTPEVTSVPSLTSLTTATIIFEPLSSGTDLGGAAELNIDFTTSVGTIYRIKLTTAGVVEYLGIQNNL